MPGPNPRRPISKALRRFRVLVWSVVFHLHLVREAVWRSLRPFYTIPMRMQDMSPAAVQRRLIEQTVLLSRADRIVHRRLDELVDPTFSLYTSEAEGASSEPDSEGGW